MIVKSKDKIFVLDLKILSTIVDCLLGRFLSNGFFTLGIKQEGTLVYIDGKGTYWGDGANNNKLKMPMYETN